jgi:gamma-glutamyltranspeptidase
VNDHPTKEHEMDTQQPSKRRSALVALAPAIAVEIGAVVVNVGGAVTAAVAFLLAFGVCHQIRLMRWRRGQPA